MLNPDARPPTETVPAHRLYHSFLRLQPPLLEPQVEQITTVHKVAFATGDAALAKTEAARLEAFLRENNASQQNARVEVDGPRGPGGYHDALTTARLAALRDALRRVGLSADIPDRPVQSLTAPTEATVVMVTRAMVIEPDCSGPKTIYTPRPTHIWSCANATALGRMVADPLDLERGQPIGPADGEMAVQGVQRYRTDKVKALVTEDTANSQ